MGVYPILAARYNLPAPAWVKAKQLKLGLDLKGGVHLVMRVHTDEALTTSGQTTGEQLRERLRTAGVTIGAITTPAPATIPRRGRAAGSRRRVPDRLGRNPRHELRTEPRRRRRLRVQAAAEHRTGHARADRGAGAGNHRSPRQRARRDRAEHLALRRCRRSAAGAAAGRVRGGAREGSHPVHRAAPVQAGRERPVQLAGGAAPVARRQGAARHGGRVRRRGLGRGRHVVLPRCAGRRW